MKDLVDANQAVEEAKEHSNQGTTFKSDANWKTCVIVTVSDASWSNEEEKTKKELKKYKSQRARMTILANPDFLEKEDQHLMYCHGNRQSSGGFVETLYKQRLTESILQSKKASECEPF